MRIRGIIANLPLPMFAPPGEGGGDTGGLPVDFNQLMQEELQEQQEDSYQDDTYLDDNGMTEADFFDPGQDDQNFLQIDPDPNNPQGGQRNRRPQPQGFQQTEPITVEPAEFLDSFWDDNAPLPGQKPTQQQQPNPNPNPNPNPGTGTPQEQRAAQLRAQETALATELNNAVNSIAFSEDMIPADFNPQDSKQLRTLLAKVSQESVKKSMQLMFKPMQSALVAMRDNMRLEMQNTNQQTQQTTVAEAALIRNIPIAGTKQMRPVVDMFFNRAMKKTNGDVRLAVIATRKALTAAGIKPGIPQPQGRQQVQGRRPATNPSGAAALDLYAPMPQQPQRAPTQQQRTQESLGRPLRRQG